MIAVVAGAFYLMWLTHYLATREHEQKLQQEWFNLTLSRMAEDLSSLAAYACNDRKGRQRSAPSLVAERLGDLICEHASTGEYLSARAEKAVTEEERATLLRQSKVAFDKASHLEDLREEFERRGPIGERP
jgi:hypothetical protein